MEEINILLLGEPGVGKSTFIKSFINSCFFAKTEGYNYKLIHPNLEQSNGNYNFEKKITQKYYYPTENGIFRIIDTPNSSPESDEDVLANIFAEVSSLEKLHAICFFMNTSLSRSNKLIEYYLKKTISVLDTPIIQNFIFIFTYGETFGYNYSQAQTVLQGVVASLKEKNNLYIPVNDTNCFCIDNNAIINLERLQLKTIYLSEKQQQHLYQSLSMSTTNCTRLIQYIKTLSPYKFVDLKTVIAVKQFLENNSVVMLDTCTKILKIEKKYKKIKHDLDETNEFLKSLEKAEKDSRFQSGENSKCFSNHRRGSTGNELDAPIASQQKPREKQELPTSSISKRNFNNKANSFTSKKQLSYTDILHSETSHTQHTSRMNADAGITSESNHKIVGILKNQHSFIQNVSNLFQNHRHENISLLKKTALFVNYLHKNNSNEDIFTQQAKLLRDGSSDNSIEDVLKIFEKAKMEAKETNQDINIELLEEISKKLEKHLHYTELFEKIFNS